MDLPHPSSGRPSGGDFASRLEDLNRIGASLSREKNLHRLLETIVNAARAITHADGGTLYRRRAGDENRLHFEIVRNDSLGIALGGTTGTPVPYEPIGLRDRDGRENATMVAAYAALRDATVNIADAYRAEGFDFSGTKAFDERSGYRSQSFLTVPMKNHEGEVIGVLQLINARDPASGTIRAFTPDDVQLAESLASQAAVAVTTRLLVQQLESLFEGFVALINDAIDDKSKYTAGHCKRVPVLTMMLAEAVHANTQGPLAGWRMNDADRYEIRLAGLLHDCGKITTPVHVVDKATKLQTLFDRIELIDTRFEVVLRDAEIAALRGGHAASWPAQRAAIEADRDFLRACNRGSEAMRPEDQERVRAIASRYRWRTPDGTEADFLSPDEIENLTIRSGTLNARERQIINHHIDVTIRMLEGLPWPRHLRRVPEYAGAHHERMDGKGYPRGLTRDQMSVPARIMGIADIFEALTARDRPYKAGKSLSESLRILGQMALDGHIDPDLFEIFVREKVYLTYAKSHLDPAQIDAVDLRAIPGFQADGGRSASA